MFLAEIGDVRVAGLKMRNPSRPSIAIKAQ
jgi:hypothetical protein